MNDGLKEINQLTGVWGSLVSNNQGGMIASAAPSGLNKPTLENITRHAIELLSAAGAVMDDLTEGVFHYAQKKLFIMDLEQAVLVVICTPSVDISLLRMTVNVVLAGWSSDSKVQKQFKEHFVERY
jgi:predicted regulator of Ras-like GTPase activity (Roadblock/LC7/MglB family)